MSTYSGPLTASHAHKDDASDDGRKGANEPDTMLQQQKDKRNFAKHLPHEIATGGGIRDYVPLLTSNTRMLYT